MPTIEHLMHRIALMLQYGMTPKEILPTIGNSYSLQTIFLAYCAAVRLNAPYTVD